MKILFLSHQADFLYGGEICTLSFMRELKKQGVEIHFASPLGPYFDRAKEFAICHEIPSQQFSRKIHFLPRLLPAVMKTHRALREIIKKENIQILHATSLKAMVYAWRIKGIPVVWHHHDILPLRFRNNIWLRTFSRFAKLILTPSEATASALREAGVDGTIIYTLPNGFSLSEWNCRPSWKGDLPFHIAVIGEISHRKGSDRIPAIVAGLIEAKAKKFELSFVGDALSDPGFGKKIKARLAEEISSGSVHFVGRKENIKELFQKIDLLLVPSRQDPFPTVIIEAGLSGVPVVASTAGGIPEMIEDGANGFLARSSGEYVEKILRLQNQSTWESFSAEARRRAERYDISVLTKELMEQYRYIQH